MTVNTYTPSDRNIHVWDALSDGEGRRSLDLEPIFALEWVGPLLEAFLAL